MSKWKAAADTATWNVRPYINGQYYDSHSTDLFEKINPATERTLCRPAVGSPADVDVAVKVARARFNEGSWSGLPPGRRGEVLMKLAELIVQHKEQLALLDSLEMGKPIQAALFDAEHMAAWLLRNWASNADKLVGSSAPLSASCLTLNVFEPRGIVGAIAPWNFPTLNAVYKIGPALAAGNAVVLKPSELSSSSALRLAELAIQAGVPPGALNVVTGLGTTVGAALAAHPDVDMISFTGSTSTGRRVMELAGRSNGKPVLLECGGKSPQIVFDDADQLDAVADAVIQNVLWNQGQVCTAHTRLLAHHKIKSALLDMLIERAKKYQPGDPLEETTTFGPLASPAQRNRVKRYIEQGIEAGADPVLRGTVQERDGCYVSPTIFDGVDSSMPIVQEEIFGPVLCVLQFNTEGEALALANGTDYGLVATVWTRDMARGRRLAHAIRAGAVLVRTSGEGQPDLSCVLGQEPQKASGFGVELGIRGLQSYSTLKLVNFSGA